MAAKGHASAKGSEAKAITAEENAAKENELGAHTLSTRPLG